MNVMFGMFLMIPKLTDLSSTDHPMCASTAQRAIGQREAASSAFCLGMKMRVWLACALNQRREVDGKSCIGSKTGLSLETAATASARRSRPVSKQR